MVGSLLLQRKYDSRGVIPNIVNLFFKKNKFIRLVYRFFLILI